MKEINIEINNKFLYFYDFQQRLLLDEEKDQGKLQYDRIIAYEYS